MLKRIGMKKIGILAVLIVVLIIAGKAAVSMFNGQYVGIKGQHLNKYQFSSGGGMTGGYHREIVKRTGDGQAMISIQHAGWYNEAPKVQEYVTDAAILDELEALVRKHRMNFWNGKRFTRMFVADGESDSYSFRFDEDSISFSSQIYPAKYAAKLRELDAVVKKYLETAEVLPGLVLEEKADEEYELPEGELSLYVSAYADNELTIKVLNGTEEQVSIAEEYTLVNAETGEEIEQGKLYWGAVEVWPMSFDSFTISRRDKERLAAGSYKIVIQEIEIPFEIR